MKYERYLNHPVRRHYARRVGRYRRPDFAHNVGGEPADSKISRSRRGDVQKASRNEIIGRVKMFSYYGSKSKIIDCYPAPKRSKIIEPFAGSARYALKWFDRDVLLVDKWDVIIKIWHYLQAASPADIMALPEPAYKESIGKYNLSEGERLLMGFMANPASSVPKREIQKFSDVRRDKAQIAAQLYKIRHWKIIQGDYKDIPNQEATWFIDPPYETGGKYYKCNSVDFATLAQWSKSRLGQVIVCENTKAHWLPFWPIKQLSGAYSKTTEAIWCNEFQQTALF